MSILELEPDCFLPAHWGIETSYPNGVNRFLLFSRNNQVSNSQLKLLEFLIEVNAFEVYVM